MVTEVRSACPRGAPLSVVCGAARCSRRCSCRPPPHTRRGRRKRVLLYTGTTGFRHTDGINGGRPVVQSALEAAGYTVDWEDCTNNGGAATNCDNANKNPRIFTDENLARYDAIVLLNSSAGPPGPLWYDAQKAVDHQVRPERRRHRRHPQRDRHGHHR